MKKTTLLLYSFVMIAFLLICITGNAQQRKISGVVLEASNNKPLDGATISLRTVK